MRGTCDILVFCRCSGSFSSSFRHYRCGYYSGCVCPAVAAVETINVVVLVVVVVVIGVVLVVGVISAAIAVNGAMGVIGGVPIDRSSMETSAPTLYTGAPKPAVETTFSYQNLLFCRVPKNSISGFTMRTYRKK